MKKPRFLLLNPHFLIITILTLGVVFTVSTLGQRTSTRQFAAQPVNLNSAHKIETTTNQDGTMGPQTSAGNFANGLPSAYLGTIKINQTSTGSTSPEIESITVTITKAEAHLIHLFIPGTTQTNSAIKPTTANQKTNQNINKWETLTQNGTTSTNTEIKNKQINIFGETRLAGGKYSEIRLSITNPKAKLTDGREVELIYPGHNLISIIRPFNIYAGQTATLTLEIDAQNSITKTGDQYIFTPFISNMTIDN